MKIILINIFILSSIVFASQNVTDKKIDKEKKLRVEKQIKKEMEREKEYAEKQTFYIDLEGAEVNEDSLEDIPILEPQDFDMDSVYD